MAYGHNKYIVMRHDDFGEQAIMFPCYFVHSMITRGAERDIAGRLNAMIVSAGFVDEEGTAYGESESLGLSARVTEDTKLLRDTYKFLEENKLNES